MELKEIIHLIKKNTTLIIKQEGEVKPKPKRARTEKGRYKADDKSTKGYNEAWVGGKAPKKKKAKKRTIPHKKQRPKKKKISFLNKAVRNRTGPTIE